MNKILTVAAVLLSQPLWAAPSDVSQISSLSSAAIELHDSNHPEKMPSVIRTQAEPAQATEESSTVSLSRAALAKQGVKKNIVIRSLDQIDTKPYKMDDNLNSLSAAALRQHFSKFE